MFGSKLLTNQMGKFVTNVFERRPDLWIYTEQSDMNVFDLLTHFEILMNYLHTNVHISVNYLAFFMILPTKRHVLMRAAS